MQAVEFQLRSSLFCLSSYADRVFLTLLYVLQTFLSYLLMLAAMTFNLWIFAGVVLGAAFGSWFFFTAFRDHVTGKLPGGRRPCQQGSGDSPVHVPIPTYGSLVESNGVLYQVDDPVSSQQVAVSSGSSTGPGSYRDRHQVVLAEIHQVSQESSGDEGDTIQENCPQAQNEEQNELSVLA